MHTHRLFRVVATVAMLLAGLGGAAAGAAENPLKNAKVGEWVEYSNRTETMGMAMDMVMKQTIVAKDDAFATMRIEVSMGGMAMPGGKDIKVALDQPYDPLTAAQEGAKVTVLAEGDETITVNGTPYACHWVQAKVVMTEPQAVEATSKIWTSKDVPVGGLVRMESEGKLTAGGQNMTMKTVMELKATGGK